MKQRGYKAHAAVAYGAFSLGDPFASADRLRHKSLETRNSYRPPLLTRCVGRAVYTASKLAA